MIGPGGVRWWTTAEAVGQLGVKRASLGDWVRRSKQAGHVPSAHRFDCPACRRISRTPGFPHVDPPVRDGGVSAYKADQLLEAEEYTADSPRGGASRVVT